jgi:putative ABC transport system ATP-binding protein
MTFEEAVTTVPAFALEGVTKVHGQGDAQVRALDGIDLTIGEGELVAITGPSGSGKTTLLQLLGALDRPTEGRVRFEERDLAALGDGELADVRLRALGFVFQAFNLIPTLTALQNVEAPMAAAGVPGAERRATARRLLAAVGLEARLHHLPSQLSGGEQQRVAIARALVNEPRVLLADEPTGNLDSATGEEITALLADLAEDRGITVVLVTHDPVVAARAGRVVRLRDGRVEDAG